MKGTGKAAVYTGPGKPMEIQEFPLPEVEPGAILVRITLGNICGSDLHAWRGMHRPSTEPRILGHEMTGRVAELGKGVSTDSEGKPLAVGDRIVYAYFLPCGRCPHCLKGLRAVCLDKLPSWHNSAKEPPYFNGAYAEYYYLRPGLAVFKVPDDLTDDMVAPINCALSEVMYGLHLTGITVGDTVVIQGAGGLGIYAAAVARDMGAGKIIVIDQHDARLTLAKEFGADEVVDMKEFKTPRDRVRRVRELVGGRGGEVVVEVVGSPQAVPEGINMTDAGGTYLWIGNIVRGQTVEVDPSLIIGASRKIIGVATYDPWILPRALDFMSRNKQRFPFHKLLSHKFKLEEINEAFQASDEGKVTRAAIAP